MKTGSCLCGAVKYEVHGPLRNVIACHCEQCRKQTGTYMSATAAKDGDLKIVESRGLKWYRSSEWARFGLRKALGVAGTGLLVMQRRPQAEVEGLVSPARCRPRCDRAAKPAPAQRRCESPTAA